MWILISSIDKKNLSSNKIFEIQISLTLKSIKKKTNKGHAKEN